MSPLTSFLVQVLVRCRRLMSGWAGTVPRGAVFTASARGLVETRVAALVPGREVCDRVRLCSETQNSATCCLCKCFAQCWRFRDHPAPLPGKLFLLETNCHGGG